MKIVFSRAKYLKIKKDIFIKLLNSEKNDILKNYALDKM